MVTLVEAFTLFLLFYLVFTPIMFFLFESRIQQLEREVEEVTLELIRLRRELGK